MSMEEMLRDLNKLINYYQKLINSISVNDCSTMQHQQLQRTKSSANSSMADSSFTSSLNASNASDLLEYLKPNKLSLNLSDDFDNTTNNTSTLLTPTSSESYAYSSQNSSNLSTPMSSTLTTPVIENLSNGAFLTRKSFDEYKNKKQSAKKKQKNVNNFQIVTLF